MNRRKFIIIAGVTAGAVVVPSSYFIVNGTIQKYAALLIKDELSYLKLEEGSVEKYVNDYFSYSNDIFFKMKLKSMYYLNITWKNSNLIKELIKTYLLSSDFFINKMDENKVVRYLGLYSPYKSPVPNPFAYTLYPPDQIKSV